MERAAARWLSCTLSMPARKTSATYAEYARINATDPQSSGLFHGRSRPRPGTPKPIKVIVRMIGMPRNTSV